MVILLRDAYEGGMTRSQSSSRSRPRVAIIGSGVIGLSCAWFLARDGARVTMFDAGEPGRGASWAAAGMIAPAFETAIARDVHPDLLELCIASAKLWPIFAADLEAATGRPVGYVPGPSLAVSADAESADKLELLATTLGQTDLSFRALSTARAREIEPALSSQLSGVLQLFSDGHVDNRLLVTALIDAVQNCDRVEGIVSKKISDPDALGRDYDYVLITAGWQSADLFDGITGPHPVGGQLLSLPQTERRLTTTIRCSDMYIAPKQDRIIVGASVEPGKVSRETNPEIMADLQARAVHICPSLDGLPMLENWAGVRPAMPDHAPVIGRMGQGTVFVATGHYRNGILLSPKTAELVSGMILGNNFPPLAQNFTPDRYRIGV